MLKCSSIIHRSCSASHIRIPASGRRSHYTYAQRNGKNPNLRRHWYFSIIVSDDMKNALFNFVAGIEGTWNYSCARIELFWERQATRIIYVNDTMYPRMKFQWLMADDRCGICFKCFRIYITWRCRLVFYSVSGKWPSSILSAAVYHRFSRENW